MISDTFEWHSWKMVLRHATVCLHWVFANKRLPLNERKKQYKESSNPDWSVLITQANLKQHFVHMHLDPFSHSEACMLVTIVCSNGNKTLLML